MIPATWSAFWRILAPGIANHLWQSTVFAAAAGVLVLVLRRNQARVRYAVWLAASGKFLVPFALLAGLGSRWAMRFRPVGSRVRVYEEILLVGKPFAQPATQVANHSAAAAAFSAPLHLLRFLPAVCGLVWLCGLLVVVTGWWLRWRRISAAVRGARSLTDGREVDLLRGVERAQRTRRPLALRLSAGALEPGVFGILRPALVWPEGISAHLDDAQIEAILVHELLHVRRRDNLAAAAHMIVQAIFWFHPLVWWLGARLVEERERACDEEVVRAGSKPEVYAESLLRACRFCVESPLACVPGVTGADLKDRVARIMTQRTTRQLNLVSRILLASGACATVAVPLAIGAMNPAATTAVSPLPLHAFDRAAITLDKSGSRKSMIRFTPNGITATNIDLRSLIREAWGLQDAQLVNAPRWTESLHYDIEAKLDPPQSQRNAGGLWPDRWEALRPVLEGRFRIQMHHETREIPVFALVVAPGGTRLTADPKMLSGFTTKRVRFGSQMSLSGDLVGSEAPMSVLVRSLAVQPELGGKPVLDETGLQGVYEWELKWKPDVFGPAPSPGDSEPTAAAPASAPLFAAVQKQLGLRLEQQKAAMPIIVIDHVEPATEN